MSAYRQAGALARLAPPAPWRRRAWAWLSGTLGRWRDRQNGMCVRCRMSPRDGFGPLFIKLRGQCRCDISRRLAAFDRMMGLPPGSSLYGWLNRLHVALGFSLSALVALAQVLA